VLAEYVSHDKYSSHSNHAENGRTQLHVKFVVSAFCGNVNHVRMALLWSIVCLQTK